MIIICWLDCLVPWVILILKCALNVTLWELQSGRLNEHLLNKNLNNFVVGFRCSSYSRVGHSGSRRFWLAVSRIWKLYGLRWARTLVQFLPAASMRPSNLILLILFLLLFCYYFLAVGCYCFALFCCCCYG